MTAREVRELPFHDRRAAGRRLVQELADADLGDAIVVGLARGGVVVAAEVAGALRLPLDALAVRKIGHPWQPEYALGAVAPGPDGVFLRASDGLHEQELAAVVADAKARADELDRRIHARRPAARVDGRTCLLVDDGLATGATMTAAVQWARANRARRIVAAVPVGSPLTLEQLRREADEVVCPYEVADFGAVGFWYDVFEQVDDDEVLGLLDEAGAVPAGQPA